jgi:hypothetical protein
MSVWGGVGFRTSNVLDHRGPPNATVRSHDGVAVAAPSRLLSFLGRRWLVSFGSDGNDDGVVEVDSMLVDRLRVGGRIDRSVSILLGLVSALLRG